MIQLNEMARVLAILGTATGKDITPDQLRVFSAALADLEPDELTCAVEWIVAEHRYASLPTPGEIRARAMLVRMPRMPGAIEAYGIASRCARLFGSHPDNLPRGFDRLPTSIKRTVAAVGGWDNFCQSENPEAMRAHFSKAYDSIAHEVQRMENLPPGLVQRIDGIRQRNIDAANEATKRIAEGFKLIDPDQGEQKTA